jgi:hypothetical protein
VCGCPWHKCEASNAARRAERASNLPRGKKDHAFGLNGVVRKEIAY